LRAWNKPNKLSGANMGIEILFEIINTLNDEYGAFGNFLNYLIFFSPVISLLLAFFKWLTKFTETQKDDLILQKIYDYWETIIVPVLNLLPRVNLPVAAWVKLLVNISKRVHNVIQKYCTNRN
jgi:hypothetical protein